MGKFEILPDYRFPTSSMSVVERETLNRQPSIAETQLTVCAANEPLRFGYGLNRVGALLLKPCKYVTSQTNLLLPFIIGRGEIDAVEGLAFESEPVGADILSTLYMGTTGQAIDPWLQQAWLSLWNGATAVDYADTLDGIAWGVLQIPPTNTQNLNNLTILARMLKVRQTEFGARVYSTNPAYWLADFLESTDYGKGETVNWSDVTALAAVNDQSVGGVARRGGTAAGVMIDTVRSLDEIEETLRAYAGCWVVRENGVVRLVPDAPASPVFAYTNAGGSANYVADSIKIFGAKRKDTPTVVTVMWTDTTVEPWRQTPHTEYAAGVLDGDTPWRDQTISMPGIRSLSWAKREAIRRLNEYITSDLTVNLTALGEAVQMRRGDVVTLTDSGGFAAKAFRLVDNRPSGLGLWSQTLKEYDPAIYSDAVAIAPSTPDTVFLTPGDPPTLTGLTLTEEEFVNQSGQPGSRIVVAWDDPDYEFVAYYLIEIFEDSLAGQLVATGQAVTLGWTSPGLREGITYAVSVTLVSISSARGTPVDSTIILVGSSVVPSDLTALSATAVGNVARITWTLPADLNLSSTDLRWGATSLGTDTAAFNLATALNRVAIPATTYETTAIPTGTWRIFAKARDTIRTLLYPYGHESANPKYFDLTIAGAGGGIPPPAVVVGDDLVPSGVSLVNMTLAGDGCWITDMAQTWAARFPAAMSTYTNPLATYHTSGTSSLTTTAIDLGVSKKGTFVWSPTWTDLSGTATAYIETSPDNSVWTTQAAGLSYLGTARYIRGKLQTLTTGTLRVCDKGRFQVQIDGVAIAIDAALNRGLILDAFNIPTMA